MSTRERWEFKRRVSDGDPDGDLYVWVRVEDGPFPVKFVTSVDEFWARP